MTIKKTDDKKTVTINIRNEHRDFNAGLFLDKVKASQVREIIVTYTDKFRLAGELLVSTLTLSAGYKLVNTDYKEVEILNYKTQEKETIYMHIKTLQKEWLELREKLEKLGIKP